jgi:hypothetical protein
LVALRSDQCNMPMPNRNSRQFTQKKTRPLAVKLQDFLDYLFRCIMVHAGYLDEDYSLQKAVDVFRGLKKKRKDGTM